MNIGDMKYRIEIQKKVETTGPIPDLDPEYENHCTVWAKVEYLKGTEFWAAKAVNAEQEVRFIIRYRKDITADMRVKFDGNFYEITAPPVPLDKQRKWLAIMGRQITPSR